MKKMNAEEIIERHRQGTATEDELELLGLWLAQHNPDSAIVMTEEQVRLSVMRMRGKIDVLVNESQSHPLKTNKLRLWPRIVAVAAAMITVFICVWLFNGKLWKADNQTLQVDIVQDIAPGKNGATIVLENGEVIALSDSKTGVVFGNQLTYNDGSKLRRGENNALGAEVVASTSRGQTYTFSLSDGTKVWLNAASTIKFPMSFKNAKERRITLNGEAFFEVAKDPKHPFVVMTEMQEVKVLGTHFNVSAYADEKVTKTTLIEGSVLVKLAVEGKFERKLIPGQQSESRGKVFQVNNDVDVEDVMAWKNGYFKFNESLERIMNKISRWYNVEVVYEVNPGAGMAFEGKISRNKTLAALLKNIEAAGSGFHFKIEGRRVTVVK